MKPEVLSPAGNMDSLVAAVRSGADAVYLGSTEFSARRNAHNFDREELKSAVDYCHIRGVRVYLTLNIMLMDSELNDALALAEYANSVGVDALILQDIGLSRVIKERFPDMEMHASTQMTVHEKSALPFLKSLGFSRVVVSREMSRSEIKDLCSAANELGMEVEVFVHGALCMCVSGQCLLSAVLGSRSGNRGLCAGPCRLPFEAPGGTGYDLSLKDLCLLDEVKDLESIGVSSLKIEGRMKRPEYVSAATFAARQAVDTGTAGEDIMPLLKDVFSRSGFTKGYYESKLGISMFGRRTKDDVVSANDAFSKIHEIYRGERASVPINISATVKQGEKIKVFLSDGKNTVSVSGDIPEKAQKKAVDAVYVGSALSKLGGTPYYAENTDIGIDDGLFVPSSVLNSLRRDAVAELDRARCSVPPRRNAEFDSNITDKDHKVKEIYARFPDPGAIPDNLSGVNAVILPSEFDFPSLPENIIKITDTPRYIQNGEKLIARLKELKKSGVSYALCGNLSGVFAAKAAGLAVIGDTGLNVSNEESAAVLEREGVIGITLSAEMTLKDISKLRTPMKKGIFAYGRLPLMLTRNCPLKNGRKCAQCDKKGYLTDRLGIEFPVRCSGNYSELFNSSPIYLADRLDEIKNTDFLVLSFTDEEKKECEEIIKAYKAGKEAPEKFTRGLYIKGVL